MARLLHDDRVFKPLVFNLGGPPADERINHVVGIAVRTFLAAYARRDAERPRLKKHVD